MSELMIKAVPGPTDITRHTLPNGITILVRENHVSPSVVVHGLLRAGSVFEQRPDAGLAHLTAQALMRGTATRDFDTLYETIESIGASLTLYSRTHGAYFFGKSLAEDMGTVLDMLGDVLRRPAFPEDQLDQLRGQFITDLQYRQQDTRQQANLVFHELLYPEGHPYAISGRGYLDTIPALSRARVQAFHRQYYGPRGMIVIVVGAVNAAQAIARIEESFGDWENPAQPEELPHLPKLDPLPGVARRDVFIPDKTQTDIVLGVAGPPRTDPDWWPAYLGNHIFGVFGMYGRLGDVLREQQGMAYYSYSRLTGGEGPGSWRVIAGVNPANLARALASILSEIERMTNELVTEDELEDVKSNITGMLPLRLQSNEGVAISLLQMERYQLGMDYLERYAETVNAVTRDQITSAAKRYLNADAYALASAGPSQGKD